MLARVAGWSFKNPWKMVAGWVTLIVVVVGARLTFGAAFNA